MQPLEGHLVVDFTRQLPGPYASRELPRLGARVVKIEPPDGDSMQLGAPAWYDAINAGKEIVPARSQGGRPRGGAGALRRSGRDPRRLPPRRLRASRPCSARAAPSSARSPASGRRAGTHSEPGTTSTTSVGGRCSPIPRRPSRRRRSPTSPRARSARSSRSSPRCSSGADRPGARITISMAHGAHRLAAHRLGGDRPEAPHRRATMLPRLRDSRRPLPDGRRTRAEVLAAPLRAHRAARPRRAPLRPPGGEELSGVFASRSLAEWLALFEDEDVCVGPSRRSRRQQPSSASSPTSLRRLGVIACPSCGQENPEGALFCNACGYPAGRRFAPTHPRGRVAASGLRLAHQKARAELVGRLEHELMRARLVRGALHLGDHGGAAVHVRPVDDPRAELRADLR